MTRPRILCVDDEPRVQQGIRRVLFKSFDIVACESGAAALELLAADDSFEVVVSDMQMPNMNGAALLAEVRKRRPELTRVLLTGHANIDAAIAAVNRGQIFRFLTKPCPPEELAAALVDAVAQHRLLTSERVLLEQTLVGSMRALSEVLALVHPEVFGQTMRQHARVRALADKLSVPHPWRAEVASMLLSVGYVVLPGEVASKLRRGETLDETEAEMAKQVPLVVERVLSHIPRLEEVRELLHTFEALRSQALQREPAPLGAQALFAVTELGMLEMHSRDVTQSLRDLRVTGRHAPQVVEALTDICRVRPPELRSLKLDEIQSGMTLAGDVTSKSGLLLMAHGQLVTEHLLQRMRNFNIRVGVTQPILCEIPLPDEALLPILRAV